MADQPVALCVHGINYGGEDYAASWQRALWRAGVVVRCVPAPWSSTGTIAGDLAGMCFSPGFRDRAVDEVRERIELVRPDLIIGHSAGQPVGIEAARLAGYTGPILTIGGPLSHPVYGRALRLVDMGEHPIPAKVLHLWNADDGVCCSRLLGTRHPGWMAEARIAVAGFGGWVREHPAELYLDHAKTAEHALAMLG